MSGVTASFLHVTPELEVDENRKMVEASCPPPVPKKSHLLVEWETVSQGIRQAKMLDSSGHCAKAQVCVNPQVMCTPHKHAQMLNVYISSYL